MQDLPVETPEGKPSDYAIRRLELAREAASAGEPFTDAWLRVVLRESMEADPREWEPGTMAHAVASEYQPSQDFAEVFAVDGLVDVELVTESVSGLPFLVGHLEPGTLPCEFRGHGLFFPSEEVARSRTLLDDQQRVRMRDAARPRAAGSAASEAGSSSAEFTSGESPTPEWGSTADLARVLGVSRDTVDRRLKALEKAGIDLQSLPGAPVQAGEGKSRRHRRWNLAQAQDFWRALERALADQQPEAKKARTRHAVVRRRRKNRGYGPDDDRDLLTRVMDSRARKG